MKRQPVTGILWWKPDQWKKAKKISTDSHVFDDNYQEWKEGAENALRELQKRRLIVYQIEINFNDFLEWCKSEKLELNGAARSRYVSMKVKERHESEAENE